MNDTSKNTLYDRCVRRLKNNPVITVILFVFAVLVGIVTFTGAVQKIWLTIGLGDDVIKIEIRAEYCDLLRPFVLQLDRTKRAFDSWNKKDLSLESEVIRDGNLKARTLLEDYGELVHDPLREDLKKFVSHYDNWLVEYDRVRVKKTSNPNAQFVFSYDFPRESEKRFRSRMSEIENMSGNGVRCE